MNQDVGNTEDLSELVQQMLKRMQNGFEVMGSSELVLTTKWRSAWAHLLKPTACLAFQSVNRADFICCFA